MKKQILTFATTFITVAFLSCSKEKVQPAVNPETQTTINAADDVSEVARGVVADPLSVNLDGWFTFDQTLKDKTGKLANGVPTTRNVLYATDRKGGANKALKLDSTYLVKILNVVQQTHSSISVWVKYGNVVPYCPFIHPAYGGIQVAQQNLLMLGTVSNPTTNTAYSRDVNNGWHHIVVTYDGAFIKLYVDAAYVIPVSHPGGYGPYPTNYIVGAGYDEYWRGYVDDLRFYSRTLSARDIQALFSL